MQNTDIISKIITELSSAVAPLSNLDDKEKVRLFLYELGYKIPEITLDTSFKNLLLVFSELPGIVEETWGKINEEKYDDVATIIKDRLIHKAKLAVEGITEFKDSLSKLIGESSDFVSNSGIKDQLPRRIIDYLTITYLERQHTSTSRLLLLLGFFARVKPNNLNTTYHSDNFVWTVKWEDFPKIFSDPLQLLKTTYSWGKEQSEITTFVNEKYGELLESLSDLFNALYIPAGLYPYKGDDSSPLKELRAPLLITGEWPDTYEELGILLRISKDANGAIIPRLELLPYAVGSAQIEAEIPIEIGSNWLLKLLFAFGAGFTGDIKLLLDVTEGVRFDYKGGINASGSIGVELTRTDFELDKYIFGTPGFTRLSYKQIAIKSKINVDASAGISGSTSSSSSSVSSNWGVEIMLGVQGGNFALTTKGMDNFIAKIIPGFGVETQFDFTLGWSNKRGLHFEGSGSLEYQLPTHVNIGPIELSGIKLGLKPKDNRLKFYGISDIAAKLGPLNASIQELGLNVVIGKNDDGNNNLGLFNLGLEPKPPTGVGLSLDTSVVKAGGFLLIKPEEGEYIGAIEIEIKPIKLAIKAIGIINTKLPGTEQQSFSLLIIITAEFSPVQLGFGFSLNGVGGLFGYKRSMQTDQIREGIKAKTLDSILFPKDIIANINRIVSDLKRVFPATAENRFLVGPMLKIGWGVSLVTAEVGIIIEVPDPVKIAILGVVRVILPDEKVEILKLQINFLGVIDFEKKLISFDAVLEESRILKTMTITGQFALRIGWGNPPIFIFSAGGFHPDFKEAPVELQKMDRLGIIIINKPNLKLGVESYFALTTNTLQFGARAFFYAKGGPYEAKAEVGFDALIQFRPFFFQIGIYLLGRITGPLLDVGVGARANLSGPNVWHIWGYAFVKLWFIEINIAFDTTFGDPIEELAPEPIEILKELVEEVAKDSNWKADRPKNSLSPQVTLRKIPQQEATMILHPDTALSFNQRLVPLEVSIEKFGTMSPSDGNQFEIEKITVVGTNHEVPDSDKKELYDSFAPGNFWEIPKEEKLSRPSFERFNSGTSFTIDSGGIAKKGISVEKSIDYEIVYLQKETEPEPAGAASDAPPPPEKPLNAKQILTLAGGNAAVKSGLSYENNRTSFQAPPKVHLEEQLYLVVWKQDLQKVVLQKEPHTNAYKSQTEAYNARKSKENKLVEVNNEKRYLSEQTTLILSTYEEYE